MASDLSQLKIERSELTKKKSLLKKYWWLLALLLMAAIFALMQTQAAVPVKAATVVNLWPSQVIAELNATGYVVAQRKAAVASKASGRLEWLGVREGSVVKRGEKIAELENSDLVAQVDQAKANVLVSRSQLREAEAALHNAKLSFERAKDLIKDKLISRADYDLSEANFAQAKAAVGAREAALVAAQAAVRGAEVALNNTRILAPFDGVVVSKNANVGDVVSPFNTGLDSKGAVVDMADMDTLEVEADVSESSLAKVKVGQPCEIVLDALPDVRLLGEVASMVPSVDRSKATVMFKIKFIETDPRVLPDMSAKVAFLSRPLQQDERSPRKAVTAEAAHDGKLFKIVDGKLQAVSVANAEKLGDFIVVPDSFAIGDSVALSSEEKLEDGIDVSIAE
ncbi:efflux RND transporter periplasmic adaptor subunit [Permianibacter aggregans]|uniref:RND family efflux transporter MFP subunit n=1 Tax=Permianibacter aggregans TaxID=1510150 RepID=A0A4R6UMW2_9GAMM|nr:efflux RND transporter periplasmic adaptor subunit [Permianibacter aggregans]QGX40738.1 efflux RND transporter periplasmic adaptor subunit [Permianibacter aggregans]TDQ48450.1 RND family efflux transporter MFP subunit [Permianibacter aggregans]